MIGSGLPGDNAAKAAAQPVPQPPLRVIEPVPFIGGAPDPKPEDVLFVTYPDTLDGWLAAWVVRKMARGCQLHVEMATYGNIPNSLEGRLWVAIGPGDATDFGAAFNARQILAIGAPQETEAAPFRLWERELPFGVKSMGSADRVGVATTLTSLAAQTYAFFFAHRTGFDPTPNLIFSLEDHLTGTGAAKFSRAIVECAQSYPWDFQTLDKLVEAADDRKRRENMIIAGQAICRYIDKQGNK